MMIRGGTAGHEIVMIIISICSARPMAAYAPDQSVQPCVFYNGLELLKQSGLPSTTSIINCLWPL
jgi:hypothetical protein